MLFYFLDGVLAGAAVQLHMVAFQNSLLHVLDYFVVSFLPLSFNTDTHTHTHVQNFCAVLTLTGILGCLLSSE